MAKAIEKAMAELLRQDTEYLPCGHSRQQAAWLGCTEEECRPLDEKIARQVQAQANIGKR